ncbi:iron-containing redox enzyme family protein [Peribacillus frigoritolerans]|uniref:iron-containing redox enzyme family protein n=1 Tax=Peribacillus frigoritolerans TaxID=450367 RepID=UPI002E1D0F95|nr:iron-containing redox enzyme family protein [Peribacillus frigoritolerans]
MNNIYSNSFRLRQKIEVVIQELMFAGGKLQSHPQFADLYPEYLFTMHSMIRASVPLMESAQERAQAMADNDQVAAMVSTYLSKHIKEEMFHDDWLLDDLEVLGVKRDELLSRPPSPTVASLVGSQYYWIQHHHPVALLGYIAILEGYPPETKQLEEMMAKTQYPREAFRTMFKHADLDPHHRDDLNRTLDQLPLLPEHHTILGLSAIHTVDLASQAILEIIEPYSKNGNNSSSKGRAS